MNRKRQILIFIIIIPLLYISFLRLGGYYLSAERVFYACEKGLHYGPSEKILAQYVLSSGSKLIVGKWDGNLSAVPVEPTFGVLWKLKSGGVSGLIPCDKVVNTYIAGEGRIIGLTSNKEVKEIFCRIEYGDNNHPSIREITMPVDEDGYFTEIWGKQNGEDYYVYISYLEGKNSKGQVVYRDGKSSEGTYYNDGVLDNTKGKSE